MRTNRSWLIGFLLLGLTSCQTVQRHEVHPTAPTAPTKQTQDQVQTEIAVPAPSIPPSLVPSQTPPPTPPPMALPVGANPKIGLILGPGALRVYGHVGVLQEFAKMRIPIQAVVGFEMGSLVGAIFANKGLPYDVEWQMMKLKESDWFQKGLLSGQVQAGDPSKSFNEFMNMSLSSAKVENSKVPFACPAYNIGKKQMYMMNRGEFSQMLPYCMALPPLFKPYQQNVAGVFDLRAAVEFVRSKGANYVVYVDLLSGPIKVGNDISTEVLWNLADQSLAHPEKGIDDVIHVPLQDFDLLDFGHRRDMIQAGQRAGQEGASRLMKKWGM